MVSLALIALNGYLAALLGISALGKLGWPDHFAKTLRRQRLLSVWGVSAATHVIPTSEAILAMLLLLHIAPIPVAAMVLILFTGFLVINVILFMRYEDIPCGCHGGTQEKIVDGASVATSGILVSLAAIYLWLVIATEPISAMVGIVTSALLLLGGLWLGWRTWLRRRWYIRWQTIQCSRPERITTDA